MSARTVIAAAAVAGAALTAAAPAMAGTTVPTAHVRVTYDAPRVYTFTVEVARAELAPALIMYGAGQYEVGQVYREVRAGRTFTFTEHFPAAGTYRLLNVDGTPPRRPDGQFSDPAVRWDGSRTVTVR